MCMNHWRIRDPSRVACLVVEQSVSSLYYILYIRFSSSTVDKEFRLYATTSVQVTYACNLNVESWDQLIKSIESLFLLAKFANIFFVLSQKLLIVYIMYSFINLLFRSSNQKNLSVPIHQ